jgi:ribosomal protein S18 acetylase RimI-like enzyme
MVLKKAGIKMNQQPEEVINCEHISESLVASYKKRGFTLFFSEEIMAYDLTLSVPEIDAIQPLTYKTWDIHTAHDFFGVYQAAFRERPGFPGWSEEEWIRWTTDDPSFRPDLSSLALIEDQPVGFITNAEEAIESGNFGFIVQMGVDPRWRGQRVGTALISRTLQAWQNEGKQAVMLHVNNNNPALHLYYQLGFISVGRRGKFRK